MDHRIIYSLYITILCCISQTVTPNPTPMMSCLPGEEPLLGSCVKCKDGYYSKDGDECLKCTICHRGQQLSHACDKVRNAVCFCPLGKHQVGGLCNPCKDCPPGFVQNRDCGHNLDRECEECPKGHTTNSTNSKKCHQVSRKQNKIEIHNHKYIQGTKVNWKMVLSICLCVFAVVLIICCIVAYKWHGKHDTTNRLSWNHNNNDSDNLGEDNTPMLPTHIDLEPAEHNHLMIKDLTANIYEDLGVKLNPDGSRNWRTLAGLLGFKREDLGRFKLEPKNACQEVLFEFSTTKNSTVFNLNKVLCSMDREDAALIIEPYIYKVNI